jgi:hypothetical protein
VKKAHDGKIAAMSIARKLARRCYHTLRALDPEVVYAMPCDQIFTALNDGQDRPSQTSESRELRLLAAG